MSCVYMMQTGWSRDSKYYNIFTRILWRSLLACAFLKCTFYAQSSHKCHPVQIHDSNYHTHSLTSFCSDGSWLKMARVDKRKNFIARNGGPTRLEDCFLSPFVQRRSLSSANQSHFIAKVRHGHSICILQVYPSTSHPCPTPFTPVKPISKGYCQKWCQKLNVSWCKYV